MEFAPFTHCYSLVGDRLIERDYLSREDALAAHEAVKKRPGILLSKVVETGDLTLFKDSGKQRVIAEWSRRHAAD